MLFAFLFSSCETKGAEVQNTGTDTQESAECVTAEKKVDDGPFGKYDPPIDISFVRTIDEDTVINILPKTPGETMEKNRWLDAYFEKLGINITYDWMSYGSYDSDVYLQKLNVTIASGTLPDIIPVSMAQLKQLTDSNMIADLTDVWDEYATGMVKEYFTQQGPGILGSSTFNGKLMGVTALTDGFGDGTFIWIRNDWLKNLGLEAPKTTQELLEIARAFTEDDPDGDGIDNTYAFAVTKDLHSRVLGLEGFFAGFHAYPNIWLEDEEGSLVYGSTLPEVKRVLTVLADMYQKGQIDKEFGVKDLSNVSQSIADGKIGIEFGAQWNPMYPLISSYYNDPEADWSGYPLVSVDDKPVYSPSKFGLNLYYVVNAECEHPEALIKLLNTHVELCWGETNDFEYYYMPKENESVGVWKFSPVTPAPPFKNVEAFESIVSAREKRTFDKLTGEAAVIQRNIDAYKNGDISQWGWDKIYGEEGVYRWSLKYIYEDMFLLDKFTGAPTPTMSTKMTTLTQMEREVFVKIVTGKEPIDAFEQFVDDWYEIGGEDITYEVNEWYSAR